LDQPISFDWQSREEHAREFPGFVLTTASALGTLAAARCLGEHGVRVVVLDAERFAPAAWSRYVVQREIAPKVRPIAPFLDALVAFGEKHPGHVLYATSDDLAWTFAQKEELLRRSFRLLTPSFACMVRVLDKRELYAACPEAGLSVPNTWFPEADADLERVARAARFPVIIKPRTQVFFRSARKGRVVRRAEELADSYRSFLQDNVYDEVIAVGMPQMTRPMIQELHAAEPVYSVSGFCEPSRGLFVARACRKILQWPRKAGVGIAFEDAPLDASVAEGVRRLSAVTGFFGVFEAEFVCSADGMRLIDYNPRFFNQLGFDVARGLPSPYFVHLLALGKTRELEEAVEAARAWRPAAASAVFRYGSSIAITRFVERMVNWPPANIPASLRKLASEATGTRIVEATRDAYDWVPAVVDGLRLLGAALKHPRATLRAASRGYDG
jgi:predicted ATP-grasp superfamily ATP-dependent carboligase